MIFRSILHLSERGMQLKYWHHHLKMEVVCADWWSPSAFVNFGQLGPNSMLWCSDDDANIFIGFLLRRGARSIYRSSWSDEQNMYFLIYSTCKVGLIYPTCIRDVSHTPTDAYIFERLGVHFTHTFLAEAFSSLLDGDGAVFLVLCLGLLGAASWWSIIDETSWGCVTHVGGWPYEYFVGWSILLIVIMPPFFIYVFGLSSIDLLVCSICILISCDWAVEV